jgi:hypothetical protein
MDVKPSVGPWPLFLQFLDLFYTVGRPPRTGNQPVAKPLPTHKATKTQNKRTHTSMPRVGFEPTIKMFERTMMVHALDRAAAVNGSCPLPERKTKCLGRPTVKSQLG